MIKGWDKDDYDNDEDAIAFDSFCDSLPFQVNEKSTFFTFAFIFAYSCLPLRFLCVHFHCSNCLGLHEKKFVNWRNTKKGGKDKLGSFNIDHWGMLVNTDT